MRAVSLNFRDLTIVKGARKRKAPVVPASDGAGEVIEVGAAVTRHAVGDRVAAAFFPLWLDGELSDYHHSRALGGSQRRHARRGGRAARDGVGEACRRGCRSRRPRRCRAPASPRTTRCSRRRSCAPATSCSCRAPAGVSIFGLQLAKAAGARVIVTSSSAAKRERALALGADHVIDYKAEPAWGESARAWTGGRGVDIVIEVGGPGTFDQSVAALRYGGTMSILGVLTGTRGEVNTYGIFHKSLRVAGIYVGSVAMFEGLVRALEASKHRADHRSDVRLRRGQGRVRAPRERRALRQGRRPRRRRPRRMPHCPMMSPDRPGTPREIG